MIQWRVYTRPQKTDVSVFLGTVNADFASAALGQAQAEWPAFTPVEIISQASWDTMTDGQRDFCTGKPVGDESFRQISPDVRSSKCETCRHEIFYRKHRSNQWRKPPTHCPTCRPIPAVSAPCVHEAYLPEK